MGSNCEQGVVVTVVVRTTRGRLYGGGTWDRRREKKVKDLGLRVFLVQDLRGWTEGVPGSVSLFVKNSPNLGTNVEIGIV